MHPSRAERQTRQKEFASEGFVYYTQSFFRTAVRTVHTTKSQVSHSPEAAG
ncbi:hypothetical protein [Spirosoma linguale]|uniref:hypothetical protein n=1 Tax=Spirosoma linguale TaxID=108 RepID=UPI003CC7C957